MQTTLIIDDDAAIGDLEQEVLERAGYTALRAYSGTEALLLLKSRRPDLVLLDLMLPGLSGEEVLPRIQGIPVIVVSAKTAVQDKVGLLLGGAADYLTKPFDTKELLARVAVRLREATRSLLAAVYACGGLTLDTSSHEVRAAGRPVQLTRTEYAILKLLMQNPGQVLAKSVLLERIGEDTPDCTENSLKTHVRNLRGKLREASGREYVEAVWGIGFRLAAES
ncbi:MAG: response regulator transcription factor [Clostridiales bacterium]|nr:response regulator transcription factor [Clostridiales bacterium]MDY2834550.1 response regulator transcription factor [Candidatus Aphodomonas sp.]